MKNRRRSAPPWVILLWMLSFTTLACTLTQSDLPPTLVPRNGDVPAVPTIGYATLSPTQLPADTSTIAPAVGAAPNITALINQIESDRLMMHVRTLSGFHTRHVNSPQNRSDFGVGAAKNYIMRQFEEIQASSQGALYVFPHEFDIEWAGVRSRQTNVVAILSGTEIGAGTIIIGAHYDSRANDNNDGMGYAPGANDNATGVAALIEVARVMAQRPHRSTVIFVAFAAEEVGRLGSIAFVNDYVKRNNIDLITYINVDAIGSQTYANGTVNDRQMRVFSKGPDTSRSRQIARTTNLVAFNYVPNLEIVVEDAYDRLGRYGDHFSFEEAGYPSIRFIEMAENTNRLDSTDTIDGVHPGYFRRTTQAILTVVTALADGPRPPTNIALRDNGDGTRTLVWEAIPDANGYVVALRRPNSFIYQQFETTENSVRWDGFTPQNFSAIAIASKNSQGMMGILSQEIGVQ